MLHPQLTLTSTGYVTSAFLPYKHFTVIEFDLAIYLVVRRPSSYHHADLFP